MSAFKAIRHNSRCHMLWWSRMSKAMRFTRTLIIISALLDLPAILLSTNCFLPAEYAFALIQRERKQQQIIVKRRHALSVLRLGLEFSAISTLRLGLELGILSALRVFTLGLNPMPLVASSHSGLGLSLVPLEYLRWGLSLVPSAPSAHLGSSAHLYLGLRSVPSVP